MKPMYEKAARCVRWIVAAMVALLVALPALLAGTN